MDAAYHCHTDDGWVEIEKITSFFPSSRDSLCFAVHGFNWSQLKHLSLYVNTYFCRALSAVIFIYLCQVIDRKWDFMEQLLSTRCIKQQQDVSKA